MKRLIAVLILLPSLCLAGTNLIYNENVKSDAVVTASDEFKTSCEFSMSGLTTETVELDGREYIKTLPLIDEMTDWGSTIEVGSPEVPVYSSMIIIPDQSGVQVNINSYSFEVYEDIDIAPVQPLKLESESGEQSDEFAMNREVYSENRFYPENLVSIGEPAIMRDFRFVQVGIQPVQYNPVTKELRVYTSINYELVYQGADMTNAKTRRDNYISDSFLNIYRTVFDNAEDVLSDYEPRKGGYLIIAPNNYSFGDTIGVLADWKHKKGYYTTVVESDEITPSGTPTSSQVYAYIENAYETWDIPPDYVLLVGDEDQRIPDYPYSSYTSDHQYSTVDGSDYISDIFLARMSVDNMNELRTAMYKVLRYEQDPYMDDPGYWKRGLGVAGNIYATSPRITNLWVRDIAMEHGYTQVDTVFDWGSGAPNWSTIPGAINNGVSYVSYRGWAGSSGWYNPSYTVSDISSLTNGWKIGIMVSIVCGTGDYGSNVCFGEAWIRYGSVTSPKGGPNYYGCTDHSTHTAYNNPNMVGFFWSLFEQGIYNFSQNMFMGKLRIYEAYPSLTAPGNSVNRYYNTYNSLGDPELPIRTEIPKSMAVSHPSSIEYGTNHMTITVNGEGGSPLENAFVNLVQGDMGDETIYMGAYTDAAGQAIFDFNNSGTDVIHVTVTARDYIPHMAECQVNQQAVSVGIDTVLYSDASGNNDGETNSGEELGLAVRLHNYGNSQNATGVQATLTTNDERVNIITGSLSYPDIAYGNDADAGNEFVIELDGDIPHGDRVLLYVDVSSNQGSWQSIIAVEAVSVKPTQLEVSFPDISGDVINPGQTADMVIEFMNAGGLDGIGITGTLSCEDEYVSISHDLGNWGNIAAGATGDNSGSPLTISVDNEAYNGRNVNFTINFTTTNPGLEAVSFSKTFSIVIGTINTFDPIGPDNYGYYIYDNTDMGYLHAPIYDWIEINPNLGGSGTRLSIATDDASVEFDPPFDITYYGEVYDYMIISTNGFVAFDTIPYDVGGNYWHNWDNWPIPDYGNARAQISPFWDDLEYTGSTNGIYTYHDQTNGLFIIEWSGCRHARTNSTETFQMIFYDTDSRPTPTGDCEIVFQYMVINNDDSSSDPYYPEAYSSVGFENYDQNDGLEYQYDNVYHPGAAQLADGLALKITTATGLAAPPDMAYSPNEFDMASEPGDQAEGYIHIDNNGDGYLFYSISVETEEYLVTTAKQPISAPLKVNQDIEVVASESKTETMNGPVNPPVILDSGGPDNFGYTWIDSNEPGGPVYNWIDITEVGTRVTGIDDEESLGPYPIGFDFNFYGNTYSNFRVCSNGYCTFGDQTVEYNNTEIPNSDAPNNMLAVYWDDMNFDTRGEAYYYNNGSDSCVISYIEVPHYSDEGSFTYQIILLRSGKIVYQYKEATGPDVNQATVGIENASGSDALQVCYNSAYIEPPMAVQISAFTSWLSVEPASSTLSPHTNATVAVVCDAADLEIGQYEGTLHMFTNDSDYPSVDIPVHFEVFDAPDCDYIPGDINGDGSVNIADVTFGVSYIKATGSVPPDSCWNDSTNTWLYAAGDVNGNCAFLGSDISYLVKFFRDQRPAPGYCAQTPPPAALIDEINKSLKGTGR